MDPGQIDLKKEQQATLARPRYDYSSTARFFFQSMDRLAGGETTLAKAKLIELTAPIPYRAWEVREYGRMTRHYGDGGLVDRAEDIVRYGREAQDTEVWHLRVISEKMKEESLTDPRYMMPPLPSAMVASYSAMTWTLARVSLRRALLFNAEFEDHAEHTYAELVDDHPEWEDQPVTSELVQARGPFASWADVFRRIALDERDHMNRSFAFAGRPQHIVSYEGMPEEDTRPQAA